MGEGNEMENDARCEEFEQSQGKPTFKEACFVIRASLTVAEELTLNLASLAEEYPFDEAAPAQVGGVLYGERRGEMIANVKLAYRHIEDARMRLGKAIQAFDGGKSCYPR